MRRWTEIVARIEDAKRQVPGDMETPPLSAAAKVIIARKRLDEPTPPLVSNPVELYSLLTIGRSDNVFVPQRPGEGAIVK
jgi:hypothetical protein